jgi:hypothetical protein
VTVRLRVVLHKAAAMPKVEKSPEDPENPGI